MLKFKLSLLVLCLPVFLSCGSSPSSGSGSKPAWVDNVSSVYNRSLYVAAVGYSSDRQMAERNAMANLSAFFGQSIQADQTIRSSYYEAARSGAMTTWSDNTEIEDIIMTSSSMDTLIGAEIREIWFDAKNNTYYAAAVMERQRSIRLYTNMILSNLEIIKNLSAAGQADRYSLEEVSRYQFAGTVADMNTAYAHVLNVLDARIPDGLTSGEQYRLEALNIISVIPIGIVVNNDRAARLQNAFANVFSELGFRTGAANPRYVLNVSVNLTNLEYPDNPYQFVRMDMNANLTDTGAQEVLLPYNYSNRDGHVSSALAENTAYTSAEQKIGTEYKDFLSSYLNRLLKR